MNKYRIIVEVTDTADGEIAYTKETLKGYVQHQLAEDEYTKIDSIVVTVIGEEQAHV